MKQRVNLKNYIDYKLIIIVFSLAYMYVFVYTKNTTNLFYRELIMEQRIVKVDKNNYFMFDDMIFFRGHNRYKNEEELNQRHYFAQYYEILDKNLLHTYAMETEGKFVGYICTVYIPKIGKGENNGYLFVDDLWVNPSYRKMGIAEKLMHKIESLAKQQGYYGLRLYVDTINDAGISLYKKCGYNHPYGTAMMMEKVL